MYRKSYSDYEEDMLMVQKMGYESYAETLVTELYNSQSAGFFIVTDDEQGFDGSYSAFGKVIEGMDEIRRLEKVKRSHKLNYKNQLEVMEQKQLQQSLLQLLL